MPDPIPQFDIVGPTVADDIRRLIQRYGAEAVKIEIRRQTALKPGMKPKDRDWRFLEPLFESDARHWLNGGNPDEWENNNSVANTFEKDFPDKTVQPGSVYKRIYNKLRKLRRYYTFLEAFWMTEASHPYQKRLEALRELSSASKIESVWRAALYNAESTVRDYRIKLGCAPPDNMTFREVENAAAEAVIEAPDKRSGNVLQMLVGYRKVTTRK